MWDPHKKCNTIYPNTNMVPKYWLHNESKNKYITAALPTIDADDITNTGWFTRTTSLVANHNCMRNAVLAKYS